MNNKSKTIKFHGQQVNNIIILYTSRLRTKPDTAVIEEFNALQDPEGYETVNMQIVSDFVTITFYKNESSNSIIRRELIPIHLIEHIWIKDV